MKNLWAGIDYKKKNRLDATAPAADWLILTLLTNCNGCFYGNEVSQQFGVPTPEIEEYLA